MALDPSGGPSMDCTTCTGMVTVDNSAGTATRNAEYYVLDQASKFVKPGAVRIDSNTFGSGNGTQLQQWRCTAGDTTQTFQLVPDP